MSASAYIYPDYTNYRGRREGVKTGWLLPAGVRSSAMRFIRKADRRKQNVALVRELPTVEDMFKPIVPEIEAKQVAEPQRIVMTLQEAHKYLYGFEHLKINRRFKRSH